MAQVGPRVDYLAGFCCPVGGLVAGKPRVLCHENEIYLSNGSEFLYVYDQEGKVLKVSGGGRFNLSPTPGGCPGTDGDFALSPPPQEGALGLGGLHPVPRPRRVPWGSGGFALYPPPREDALGPGGLCSVFPSLGRCPGARGASPYPPPPEGALGLGGFAPCPPPQEGALGLGGALLCNPHPRRVP